MEGKKPLVAFQAGAIRGAIWKKTVENDGQTYQDYSIQIIKCYKDGEEWKKTSHFRINDLPKIQLVAGKAFEFLSMKKQNSTEVQ